MSKKIAETYKAMKSRMATVPKFCFGAHSCRWTRQKTTHILEKSWAVIFQVLLSLFVKYNARKHDSKLFYKWKVSFERNCVVRPDKGLTLEMSVSFISHGGNDIKLGTLLQSVQKTLRQKICFKWTDILKYTLSQNLVTDYPHQEP